LSRLKKEITGLLEKKDYNELVRLSSLDKKVISILISLSYDKNNPAAWRAMEAVGLATGEIAKSKPDSVRNIAGRLLWMLRDESGGIGWSAPEILGEIVRNNPSLCADIAPIIASFHEEKMLVSGVLWAMGRIGRINSETVDYAAPIVRSYLGSPDKTLRGYAAFALGEMGAVESPGELEQLQNDGNVVSFYEDGELREKTVGEIVSRILEKLEEGT